jgi:hypothetical protein
MHRLLLHASVLALLCPAAAEAAERRTIGRVGAGFQLGGFYDLGDPALELRGWAGHIGVSASLGRHLPEASEPGLERVMSDPGQQVTGGVLLAFVNPKRSRPVTFKPYGTVGVVHVTQARATWQQTVAPTRGRRGGVVGETAVEGQTGTWPFAGAGVEIGFGAVPGLAVGSELLLTFSGDGGAAPGLRFGIRYYPW